MQNQGGFGGGGDGDLPSSLPSYMPPASQGGGGGPTGLPFGYNLLNQSSGKTEGDAAGSSSASSQRLGQWKTPGQFLYMGNGSRPVAGNKDATNENTQSSPSSGMRSMSFQEGATPPGYQMLSGAGGDKADSGTIMALKLGRQDGVTNSQISAAQFAASTGGLAMDTALLARVSGTDPAMMGSEEIKQIMRTPDLLSIYQKLQEEDDRRQRRLERNRASARVRREKKKGMVETYEGEVSKLESSLNLLKAHTFGAGQAQELASALEYSSGEHLRHALMSKEAKMELMARILGQHSRNTDAIRRANSENQVLIAAASDDSELSRSLRAQLGLTEEQCRQLQSLEPHAREEARKLDAIRKCFSALRAHDWLYVPGIETILHQSRNTMTPHQFQKFLSWTVENRPAIEHLQFLPTPSAPESERDLTFIFSED